MKSKVKSRDILRRSMGAKSPSVTSLVEYFECQERRLKTESTGFHVYKTSIANARRPSDMLSPSSNILKSPIMLEDGAKAVAG